jgi:uncharacterized lipoprotein YmbA
MKSPFRIAALTIAAVTGMVLAGCSFKPLTISTRHFILAPISTNEPGTAAAEPMAIGIGAVKLPGYLLRESMAVRMGPNEIEYLRDAYWAERLDQSIQQTLATDLAKVLPADRVYLTEWGHDQVQAGIFINIQQFDVDAGGNGTLIAQWRINVPGKETAGKTGSTRLVQAGSSPRGNPGAIAATLSDLLARFSRELAGAVGGK